MIKFQNKVSKIFFFSQDTDDDEPTRQENGTTDAFNNFLQKRASAIPTQATSGQQVYPNLQQPPINNQKSNTRL